MFIAEMCFLKISKLMSGIFWVPSVPLNNIQSIRDWRGRCVKSENHLEPHIVADGNEILLSGAIPVDLAVHGEGG